MTTGMWIAFGVFMVVSVGWVLGSCIREGMR